MTRNVRIIFTSPTFPEFLLRILGRSGILPYQIKCLTFGILLYLSGIVFAYVSNTLYADPLIGLKLGYLNDIGLISTSIVAGITFGALINFLEKVDDIIERLSVMNTPQEKDLFEEFIEWANEQAGASKAKTKKLIERCDFWYYLEGFGGALIGLVLGLYFVQEPIFSRFSWINISHGWSSLFFVIWCFFIAHIIGVSICCIFGAVKITMRYGKLFLKPEKIRPLNPDKIGGLKPLGQLALGMDIVVAIPSTIILLYLVSGTSLTHPFTLGVIILYTLLLVVVFFIPLSSVHNAMLEAKEQEFSRINRMFNQIYDKIFYKEKTLTSEDLENIQNIYYLYGEAKKMAVWPLDLSIIYRFVATSLFPLVGSIAVNYLRIFLSMIGVS